MKRILCVILTILCCFGFSSCYQDLEEDSESNRVEIESVIETYTGILTGYGPDCVGCGNPKTGKEAVIEARNVISFRPAKNLKSSLN